MRITKARLLGVSAIGFAALSAQPAFAQVANSNMAVSADVAANCTVDSTPINFGTVDVTTGAAVLGTGGITVLCTNGTAWSASADAGTGAGATLVTRQLSDGANTLNYGLYTEPTRTTIWGDGAGGATATIDAIGTGADQAQIIYGRIDAGQNGAVVGAYADTVVVTVTY